MTLGDYLNELALRFEEMGLYFGHGTDNAWDEAVQLACFVLDITIDADPVVLARELTAAEISALEVVANNRIQQRKPLPYLTQQAWFCGLPFYVNEQVIIPRSPIGEWIECGFEPWLQREPQHILDMCCGSGCLAICCALAFPNSLVDAVDISPAALTVAQKNVAKFALQKRVNLIESDLFNQVPLKKYDLVVCNPPYVSPQEMAELPREYQYEPHLALHATEDGLAIVRKFLTNLKPYLAHNAIIVLDLGNTAEKALQAFPEWNFVELDLERGGSGTLLATA